MKGIGEQRQYWGAWNIENQDFEFGEQSELFQEKNVQVATMITVCHYPAETNPRYFLGNFRSHSEQAK